MSLRLLASTLSVLVVSTLSALAGPFDDSVGKYKGSGVEYSDAVYYYSQTIKVEGDVIASTKTIPGYLTTKETIQFREDGKIRGSGWVVGYGISWTIRGTWRQEGEMIKGSGTASYNSGVASVASFSIRFKDDGKLVVNELGYSSSGFNFTTSFKGRLTP